MIESSPDLSVAELSLLFTGDEWTEPYPHFNLVLAICDQAWPASAYQLMCTIYGVPEEGPESTQLAASVEESVWRTIEAGYRAWCVRQQRAA